MLGARAQRRSLWATVLVAMLGVGCGGGNDGTFVDRSTVAVRGVVDDGLPASPVADARCRALDLDGRELHAVNADSQGAFVLLVDPGVRGYIACSPPGQPAFALRALLSTAGMAEGSDLENQVVMPQTTPIARLVAQEFSDGAIADPVARYDALLAEAEHDPDLRLLSEAATLLFNALRGAGNADFEALFMDLVDDSVLDASEFEQQAEAIDAGIAELEAEHGRSMRQAFLARFPPFDLSVLHHSGGASALLHAGEGATDFGGIARFAAVVDDARFAAANFGGTILLSAGDQIGPGLILQATQDRLQGSFDAEALSGLGYAAMAPGPRDLALGPVVWAEFVEALDPPVPMVISTLDAGGEQNLLGPILTERLPAARILEVHGRRVGVLSAVRPDFGQVSSPRRLAIVPDDDLVELMQERIDTVHAGGARVVILLSQQADLAADMALAEQLSGVDVVVAGAGDSLLASAGALLVPGDEAHVVGDYPQYVTDAAGVTVPVVSTAGRYRYLGRLDVHLDPLGEFLGVDELNSGPIRVAGPGTPDGVTPDPDLEADVIMPLMEALDALAADEAADARVELDATAAGLRSRETNFGNLLADAVFALARAQAQGFGSVQPSVALVDAGSVMVDAMVPTGSISRADLYDLVNPETLVTVIPSVDAAGLKRLVEHALAEPESAAFLQLSGLRLEWDPAGVAQQLDADGEVVTEGTRVRLLRIRNGPALVEDGVVQEDTSIFAIATTSRVARGVLGQPAIGGPRTNVGLNLPQALSRYLIEGLNRRIRDADYPPEGEDRIRRLDSGG